MGKVYLSDEMSCGQSCLYWLAYLLIHSHPDGQQMFPVYIGLTFKFSFSDIWVFAAMPKPNSDYQLGICLVLILFAENLFKKIFEHKMTILTDPVMCNKSYTISTIHCHTEYT